MLFFRKAVKRVVDPKATEKRLKEEPLDLEKGDIPAIILAAFLTIGPIVLVIAGVLLGLYFLFIR